jgi:serine protease inhibitor
MANKLYADVRGFEIADKFNATLIASYDTTIERLNFADSERARTSINDWVQQMTRDKIRDLIPSGTLLIFILSFFIVPHDYLLLDSAPNIGRLISPWELDKLKNC